MEHNELQYSPQLSDEMLGVRRSSFFENWHKLRRYTVDFIIVDTFLFGLFLGHDYLVNIVANAAVVYSMGECGE